MKAIIESASAIADEATKDKIRCGFCLKTQRQVRRMVRSEETGVAICDQCVFRARALIEAS